MSCWLSSMRHHPQYGHSLVEFWASLNFCRSVGLEASAGRVCIGAVGQIKSYPFLAKSFVKAAILLLNDGPFYLLIRDKRRNTCVKPCNASIFNLRFFIIPTIQQFCYVSVKYA